MRGRARGTTLPLQQADFDALPYSVQRKYFSSLERLQIRQQSVDEPTTSTTSGRTSQASSSAKPHRPSLSLSLSRSLGPRRRRRRPDCTPAKDQTVQHHDISHAEVDFFLSLPEKVRKQHFSREEQVLLEGRRDQEPNSEWAQQRFDDFHFDFSQTSLDPPDRGRPRRRSSASSSVSPSRASFGTFTLQEKDQDRASSLLYLDMMATPVFPRREAPLVDMRRTMSLTAHSIRHAPSPAMAVEPPLYNPGARPRHQRAHSSSLSGRRSSHTPTTPVFDPEATHYQDPEARKKLRMYLASPQKFDEAIEFGFPSTTDNDTATTPHFQLPPIGGHARKFSRDMHTFLRDGKLSFFEDNSSSSPNQGLESDADSVADMESPTTPSSTGLSFRLHSHHRKFSVDSPVSSPAYSATGQLNRDMTLRMTLTRPDLRADEDKLYGWQGANSSPKAPKDDPLALEDLVLTDDMTGTKGAFYVKPKPRGNLVSRLLKRASLKGR
ncbi:hypothetical protein BDW02DRAFT_570463 [Decorospora gaudefroyi]|uniref:Mucin-like protein n=1 Tax=Decorospora gaudefroyi TaxID=184978 RepID=A0A6A5KHZ9_9PLEO|nr:hypothetical protein BDW02DRAFT_570463 [Decorospora gaudefroyi]